MCSGVAFAVTGSFSNCHGSVSQCEQVQEANKHTSYGLMIAATIAAVLFFPPLATLFVYALIEILTGRAGEDQPDTNTCELQATNCNQLQTEEPDGQNDDGCIEFPDHKAVNFDIKKLRSLSVPAAVMLGLTFLCFTISLVGCEWSSCMTVYMSNKCMCGCLYRRLCTLASAYVCGLEWVIVSIRG